MYSGLWFIRPRFIRKPVLFDWKRGNRNYRVLLYSNYPGLSGYRLSVSDVSACATKGRCPICIAFFYPARLDIGRTNCDLLRGATVLCAAPFLGLSKDVANSGYAQLEEALWVWFGNIRSRRLAISDEMFRVKAKEFGETMGISGLFTACNTVLSINIHATIQIEDTFLSDI